MAHEPDGARAQGRQNAPTERARCAAHIELQAEVDLILAEANPLDLLDPVIYLAADATSAAGVA